MSAPAGPSSASTTSTGVWEKLLKAICLRARAVKNLSGSTAVPIVGMPVVNDDFVTPQIINVRADEILQNRVVLDPKNAESAGQFASPIRDFSRT